MQDFHLKERFLKPYGEPVSLDELKAGEVYFTIQFAEHDRDGLSLIIEDVASRVYFQDLESYQAGIRYGTTSSDDRAVFYAQKPESFNMKTP
jgi:hypothetical protein